MRPPSLVLPALLLTALLLPLFDSRILPDGPAWILDLLVHWQWLYAALLLPLLGVAALRTAGCRRWLSLALLPACTLPLLTAAPALMPSTSPGSDLRIATANLHLDNRNPSSLLAWLQDTGIEVLVVQELSPAMAQALRSHSDFHWQMLHPENSPFGIGVLSHLPLQRALIRSEDGLPVLDVTLDWHGRQVRLLAVHPMPPLGPQWRAQRDAALLRWADELEGEPALLVGDLNVSPWAAVMHELAHSGWQRGSNLQPSWPAMAGGWMGIPIDQVLGNRYWQRVNAGSGPAGASDHRPQWVQLSLAAPAAAD